MNLVIGHQEGECRRDTNIHHKADQDRDHDVNGDGTLRISGFYPCKMGRVLGQ